MNKEEYKSFRLWFEDHSEELGQLTPQSFTWVHMWKSQLARLATVARQECFEMRNEDDYLLFCLWQYERDLEAGLLCALADRESGR
ncbi:MAG: hypothetical protein Q8R13_04760 [bacterium]|nr:hypothetical protein [bacterium]